MADIAKLSTGVRTADIPERQLTTRLAETMATGDVARLDTTNGTFTGANAGTAGEATVAATVASVPSGQLYVLLSGGVAGEYVTGVSRGKIAGFDVSGRSFGDLVYLSNTDKALADAAGTIGVVVGRVIPATATAAVPFDKIVEVG